MIRGTWQAACCAALAAFVGLSHGQTLPARPAAVVKGVTITTEEVDAELKYSPMEQHLTEPQRRLRHMEALGLLIDNVLIRKFLDRETGRANPADVAQQLANLEAGLAREQPRKDLALFCQETRQTIDQLKASIAERLRWKKFADNYMTEARLQTYYQANKDFFDRVTVRASHIVLRVPSLANDAEKARIRARLEQYRNQLRAVPHEVLAAEFANVARSISQDIHAEKGGDVGFFPRKWAFDEPFAQAAFALKVGELSDVVRTEYGYHLIYVTARKPGTPSTFEQAREAVRALCDEDLRQDVLAQERKAAQATGDIRIELPEAK
jgi:peptidyl-prolyl cis-trans isomerase C